MYSMTGFGKGTAAMDGREVTIELKSVNHRFLDVAMRLPHTLNYLEEPIRSCLQARLSRGHVEVWITYNNTRKDATAVKADLNVLSAYMDAFASIKAQYDLRDELSLMDVARLPEVMKVQEAEEDTEAVTALTCRATEAALDAMIAMRAAEGVKMRTDIAGRCDTVRGLLREVEAYAPSVVEEYRARLKKSIEKLTEGAYDESRFNQEVAFFADKCAIDEEIVRLHSHLDHVLEAVDLAEPVGRKLDFLVQEMNRETNTIGSKAQNIHILNNVVLMKSEIEKLREQVQNIE